MTPPTRDAFELIDTYDADHPALEGLVKELKRLAKVLNSKPKPIFGFYEERYPSYSHIWENELQSPMTAAEANGLVDRIKELEQRLSQMLSPRAAPYDFENAVDDLVAQALKGGLGSDAYARAFERVHELYRLR